MTSSCEMKQISVVLSPPKEVGLVKSQDARKTPQYIAAIAASFSAFSTGTIIAWTMQISPKLLDGEYGFPIDQDQLGWIGSLISLGAAVLSLFVGSICDWLGRKTTKLLMVIPMSVGWALILWATNVEMLYIGRLLTGMVGGAFLVTAPLYCNEISQDEIRGSLGSLTQLMITLGLLFDAVASKFMSMFMFTSFCFGFPFLFAVVFVFMPESPVFYLKKNREGDARRVLKRLRGPNYDIDMEVLKIKATFKEESKSVLEILKESSKKRATKMAFFITVGLMTFRFVCGVDAITAFTSYIFKSVSEDFDPEIGPIILVTLQAIFGGIQSVIVDKIGRRILLVSSQIAIALSTILVGIAFLLKNKELVGDDAMEIINYVPLTALCIFYIGFAVGLAPLPLMLNAELNPQETKSLVTSFNTFFGWMLAFVVTKTFLLIEEAVGAEGAFFIYGGISLVGVFFTVIFVPETKGKTAEEIQLMLEKR